MARPTTYFGTGDGIPGKWSLDGLDWNDLSSPVFATPPSWTTQAVPAFTGSFWAPDVAYFNGRYHLYYSVSEWGTIDSAIGVVSTPTLDPSAPGFGWTDHGKVVQSDAISQAGPDTDTTAFNAIDPSILNASDGRLWMAFGSYSSGILVTELNPLTGDRMNMGTLVATLVANNAPGGGWGSTVEGAALIERDGFYYLFANHGGCCSGVDSSYDIRVGRSSSPTGPFLDKDGVDLRNGGGSLFLDDNGRKIGPGHFSRLTESDGSEYFGYHYYDGDLIGAPTYGRQPLFWSADGWPSAAEINPDWRGILSEDWGQSGNWWDGVVPDGVGAVANFGSRSSNRSLVDPGTNRTVGNINFHAGGTGFTIRDTGAVLTLDAVSGQTANINVHGGSQSIQASLVSMDRMGVNVISSASLTLGDVSSPGLTKYGHGTLTFGGTSVFNGVVAMKWGSVEVTGDVVTNQFTSVGQIFGEEATLTLRGSGSYTANGDFNVGDTGNSVDTANGTLNIRDQATLTVNTGGLFVGAGFFANTRAEGTVNQTGGVVVVTNPTEGLFHNWWTQFESGGRNVQPEWWNRPFRFGNPCWR